MLKLLYHILKDERGRLLNLPSDVSTPFPQIQAPQSGGLDNSVLLKLLIAKQQAKQKVKTDETKRTQKLADDKELAKFKENLKGRDETTTTVKTDLSPGELFKTQNVLGLEPEEAVASGLGGLTKELPTGRAAKPSAITRALQLLVAPGLGRKEGSELVFTPEANAIRRQAAAQAIKGSKLKTTTKKIKRLRGDTNIDKTKIEDFTADEEQLITENLEAFPDKTRAEIISALKARKFIK